MNYYKSKLILISIFIILTVFLLNACKINYSFTGASISQEVKTVSIQYFPNNAPLVQPTLSQALTEALKDKFLSETNLTLLENFGDINFEGSITGYSVRPIAIQANETAAQNRLTITINVKFTNTKDEKQNYETNFTRYADYLSSKNLSEVEEEKIKEIDDQLVEDIFNKAMVNW
ncbi:MAG: LptE family protein [Bacteroidota bacterium]